jgi:hypothetical protein
MGNQESLVSHYFWTCTSKNVPRPAVLLKSADGSKSETIIHFNFHPPDFSSTMSTPLIVACPDKGIKVDASIIATSFRQEVKDKVQALKKAGIGKLY